MLITHLIFSLTTGGAETMLVDIANEQAKLGSKVNIVIINEHMDPILLSTVHASVSVFRIGRKPGSRNPWYFIKLNKLLQRLNPDVIHCHTANIAGMLLPVFRKKAVLTLHTVGIPITYLGHYPRLYAISEAVQKDIQERTSFNPIIIYNGIRIQDIPQRNQLSFSNLFKIVVIGRLDHLIKGQHILIEAIRFLSVQGFHSIQVDIIGEGTSLGYLQKLTDEYQLNKLIHFRGGMARREIYESLQNYHLLIQPSLIEGFGLTVVEGMIARLPVLVSGTGPIEIIRNGKYGYCFSPGDVQECAAKIIEIMEGGETINSMIEEAGRYAEKTYSIQNTAGKYLEDYKRLFA